jgi:hypothetical protein
VILSIHNSHIPLPEDCTWPRASAAAKAPFTLTRVSKLVPVIFVFRLETMQSDCLATMSTFRHSVSLVPQSAACRFTRVAEHQRDGISKEELP